MPGDDNGKPRERVNTSDAVAGPAVSEPSVATQNGQPNASLRVPLIPRDERWAAGKALRKRAPRSSLAEWEPSPDRVDPVGYVLAAHEGRQDHLIPVRVGRMVESPFGFVRGTAGLMASDLARLPDSGITPVICGDAHLGNFGFYASPERTLVFDVNDFDEAHPGCWEWDVRRLVATAWVAGRQNGLSESDCADAARSGVSGYRNHLRRLANEPLLARAFDRLDVDGLREQADKELRSEIDRSAKRARKRTSDRALSRFTEESDGVRRIVDEPPLTVPLEGEEAEQLGIALDDYLASLPPQWRRMLAGYTVRDIAHRVVGVGSVGLRAYLALCEGSHADDVLFLQLKQARRSVVARYVHGDTAWHEHQGQRVVEYQQALQTVSDPLLGWTSVGDRQFYVRQFRDMKGAIDVDELDADALADYTQICGHLLAKGHARTTGASRIAGYLGKSDAVDEALAEFAGRYADQVEQDYEAFCAAVKAGKLPVEHDA